jgi:hypothetical protein
VFGREIRIKYLVQNGLLNSDATVPHFKTEGIWGSSIGLKRKTIKLGNTSPSNRAFRVVRSFCIFAAIKRSVGICAKRQALPLTY